jgi:hypothetical protein
MANDVTAPASAPAPATTKKAPESIYLVSYPKIVYLYPTFLASLVCAMWMLFVEDQHSTTAHVLALSFLAVLGINLIVLSFEFPRTTSLTLFFFLAAVAIGLWALFRFNPNLVPPITNFIRRMNPTANATFYFVFAGLLAAIYIGVMISVRFDYWEVRPNELLHHHGFLSDLKRFSAPHLRIEKEVPDVFEFMLLRSGRLILHPSNEPRAIVLDNVPGINRKEEQITRMLGALQVQVRHPGEV